MGSWLRLAGRPACALFVAVMAGCASTNNAADPGADPASTQISLPATPPSLPNVTLTQPETTLGFAVRRVGETTGGGIVLMNGIEDRIVGPLTFQQTPMDQAAAQLAGFANCAVQITPFYYFLYPAGYEQLIRVSIGDRIHPALNQNTGGIAFGSGLPLHTLFLWIGYARNITLVPDNLIAESRTGEMALGDMPLSIALEAVLKSARVVAFEVESTDEYIFIRAEANGTSGSQLLNAGTLDESRRNLLERRATVMLPNADSSTVEVAAGAAPLGTVLESLSNQLGVRVVAENRLHKLPVTPAVYNNARIGTILDLLIRQWPVPSFGYHVLGDRIVIAARQGTGPDAYTDQAWENLPILD